LKMMMLMDDGLPACLEVGGYSFPFVCLLASWQGAVGFLLASLLICSFMTVGLGWVGLDGSVWFSLGAWVAGGWI